VVYGMNDGSVNANCKVCRKLFDYYENECDCNPLCDYKTKCQICHMKERESRETLKLKQLEIENWVKQFLKN
jgi:tRNA/tmRNA/rRNA uracil-C5-methylase (TrmA/RlmC/RlmD family)